MLSGCCVSTTLARPQRLGVVEHTVAYGYTEDEDQKERGEAAWLLRRQPTGQQKGQCQDGDGDYERRDNQCQQDSSPVRLPDPGVLLSVHSTARRRATETISMLGRQTTQEEAANVPVDQKGDYL